MLEGKNVTCVRGERTLFVDLNFSVAPGTLLQVTGANGSGKTSLLRIICGLLPAEKGEVQWQGKNIRTRGEEYFSSLSYLGHLHGVKEDLTSLENLRISNALNGTVVSREQATTALNEIGLGGRENLPVRFLSEGQKKRSALARLLTAGTSLWVLDEVLASLDKKAVEMVHSLLGRHLNQGGIAVVATHHELKLPTGSLQRLELS